MKLRIGVVQAEPVAGSVAATFTYIEHCIREAMTRGCHLVVFPELFITGYFPSGWEKIPSELDVNSWMHRLSQWSSETGVWVVIGHPAYEVESVVPTDSSIISPSGEQRPLFNAATLMTPDGPLGTYAKSHLFDREAQTFVPGDVIPVWKTPWGRISVQICFDLEFPEAAREAALAKADVIIYPSNNMDPFYRYHHVYAEARAMENHVFVVYCNRVGDECGVNFCGGSGVVDPSGNWLVQAGREPRVMYVELDLSVRRKVDPSLDYLSFRRPEIYRALRHV